MEKEVEVLLDLIEIYANVQKHYEKEKSLDQCAQDVIDFEKKHDIRNSEFSLIYEKLLENILEDILNLKEDEELEEMI